MKKKLSMCVSKTTFSSIRIKQEIHHLGVLNGFKWNCKASVSPNPTLKQKRKQTIMKQKSAYGHFLCGS